MVWQDIVITLANVLFIYSTLNQVIYGFKVKKGTITYIASGGSALGLMAMGVAFLTLELYLSSFVAFLSSILWIILFIQRIIYKKA